MQGLLLHCSDLLCAFTARQAVLHQRPAASQNLVKVVGDIPPEFAVNTEDKGGFGVVKFELEVLRRRWAHRHEPSARFPPAQ